MGGWVDLPEVRNGFNAQSHGCVHRRRNTDKIRVGSLFQWEIFKRQVVDVNVEPCSSQKGRS